MSTSSAPKKKNWSGYRRGDNYPDTGGDGGYFPNSIIINIQTKNSKAIKFERSQLIDHDSPTSMGILHLPQLYKSAFIIDGDVRGRPLKYWLLQQKKLR